MGKASFFSESKCRTNGKEIMVLYLHKFEPPQIMQPSFTTLRASTYTPPSLFSPRFPFCPQHLTDFQTLQKSPSYCQKLAPTPYLPSPPSSFTERMECNMELYMISWYSWGLLMSLHTNLVANITIVLWHDSRLFLRNRGMGKKEKIL